MTHGVCHRGSAASFGSAWIGRPRRLPRRVAAHPLLKPPARFVHAGADHERALIQSSVARRVAFQTLIRRRPVYVHPVGTAAVNRCQSDA